MDLDRYRTPTKKGTPCLVGQLLADLDDERSRFLQAVLQDPQVVWARLEQYSPEDFGVKVPAATASRHARGRCACD